MKLKKKKDCKYKNIIKIGNETMYFIQIIPAFILKILTLIDGFFQIIIKQNA